jgi:hypothetical protein
MTDGTSGAPRATDAPPGASRRRRIGTAVGLAGAAAAACAPRLGAVRVIYRTESGSGLSPEPQDFRHRGGEDAEVLLAEYVRRPAGGAETGGLPRCAVKGVDLATGAVRTYVAEPGVQDECEGISPDQEHICLECSVDTSPPYHQNIDLWKLRLDGSGRRVRLTGLKGRWPWRATNSSVSPDGRWLAVMVNRRGDEAGYGRGLLDLAAWEASPEAQLWGTAPTVAYEAAAQQAQS